MSVQTLIDTWRQWPLDSVFQRQSDFPASAAPEIHGDVLKRFYPDYPLLPIEFLKNHPDLIEAGFEEKTFHSFLSSGTTQRDRSRSSFSKTGLDLYREFSLISFLAMLRPFFKANYLPAGYSMIPGVAEWPTSSLAQMVAWIGEELPLTYWNENTPLPDDNRPVWLFATGFHIVAFADAGDRFPLPRGSIVIETGGTKGKTRSVTREESYELIERCFGVDRNHIVSEYGMCELASQAYDFVHDPKGPIAPLAKRWFRFPGWAQTKILGADHGILSEGDGTLIVDDRIRTDLAVPFRTEDRVQLRADGAFQLKGRVAFSPLKGCSLLAEDLLRANAAKARSPAPMALADKGRNPHPVSQQRACELHERTWSMLRDPQFHALIQRSLGLKQLADWCLADLMASVPPDAQAWADAAEATKNSAESWLIIPPKTHDFAIMHPLFLAALLDIRIVIRASVDAPLLKYWLNLFQGFWDFEILAEDWRLTPGEALPCQSLLVYGSDETIMSLREATSQPVQGFGSWITLSIIHRSSWLKDKWVKDAFSLRQQGCMSARLLIVWDDEAPPPLVPRPVTIGRLTHGDHLHLAHSELDFALEGWDLLPRATADSLVIGQRSWREGLSIEDSLSPRPLTLPVLRASQKDVETLIENMKKNTSFKLLSADAASQVLLKSHAFEAVCDLGRANAAKWTGFHGGQPLFFPEQ